MLPHCAPAVHRANGAGSAEAAHQWDLWWDRSLSNNWNGPDQNQEQLAAMWWLPPDFESLQAAPALQEVVARHFDNARQWARDRKQEHIELVKLMIGQGRQPFQRRLKSREAQPFQLQVTVIPVAGRELWQLDAHHVLVTAELLRDSDQHRRLMTPVVRALM